MRILRASLVRFALGTQELAMGFVAAGALVLAASLRAMSQADAPHLEALTAGGPVLRVVTRLGWQLGAVLAGGALLAALVRGRGSAAPEGGRGPAWRWALPAASALLASVGIGVIAPLASFYGDAVRALRSTGQLGEFHRLAASEMGILVVAPVLPFVVLAAMLLAPVASLALSSVALFASAGLSSRLQARVQVGAVVIEVTLTTAAWLTSRFWSAALDLSAAIGRDLAHGDAAALAELERPLGWLARHAAVAEAVVRDEIWLSVALLMTLPAAVALWRSAPGSRATAARAGQDGTTPPPPPEVSRPLSTVPVPPGATPPEAGSGAPAGATPRAHRPPHASPSEFTRTSVPNGSTPHAGTGWRARLMGRRVRAAALDAVLVYVGAFLVVNLVWYAGAGRTLDVSELGSTEGWGAVFLLFPLAWGLYSAVMESSRARATLGKSLAGLVVTRTDGSRLSFARALARFAVKQISLVLGGIGFLPAVWTERAQTLHDAATDTVVVPASPSARKPAR